MNRILIAHSEEAMQILFSDELVEEGYDVSACGSLTRLFELLAEKRPDLLIIGNGMERYSNGDIIKLIRGAGENLPVILCGPGPAPPLGDGFGNTVFYDHNSSSLERFKHEARRMLGGEPRDQEREGKPCSPASSPGLLRGPGDMIYFA